MPVGKLTRGYAPVVNGKVKMPVCETRDLAVRVHGTEEIQEVKRSRHSDLTSGKPSPHGKRWHP